VTFQKFETAPASPGYCRICGTHLGPFVMVDWFDNEIDQIVLICDTCTVAATKALGHKIMAAQAHDTDEKFLRLAAHNEKLRHRLRRMAALVESLVNMGWAGTDSEVCWCPYCAARFASANSLQGHINKVHTGQGSLDGTDAPGVARILADPDSVVESPPKNPRGDDADTRAALLEIADAHDVKVDGRWGAAKIRKALNEAGVNP
jgi:hypothetical protein